MPEQTIDSSVASQGAEVHSAESIPGGTIDWRTSIPADLRSEKSLANIKDLPSLVKGYVEAQRFVGGSIRIPGEKATPEEIKEFNKKLGVPEKSVDYKISKPILPEYVGWNDTVHTQVLDAAHSAGLTTKQTAKVVEGLSKIVQSITPDPNAQLEKAKEALQAQWGENFGRNLILSTRAAEHLGGQELLNALAETGAGAHPVILEALRKLGSGLLEQGLIKNEETKLETVQDAQKQIDAIKGDSKHAYWDAKHPNHAQAVQEYRRLLQLIDANK